MNSIDKAKLIQIMAEYVPKEVTRNQLIDWFIQTQDNNRHFLEGCTVVDLIECAKAADIKIKYLHKSEIKIKIEVPKIIKKTVKKTDKTRKINKNIAKSDIIELYIRQDYSILETSKKLHCSTSNLIKLIKEFNIIKLEKSKNYNPEEFRKMYQDEEMSLVTISNATGYSISKIYSILTQECKIKLRSRKEARRLAC